MGKTSVGGERLSLILKGMGAIAPIILGIALGGLPGQAAELQRHLALTASSRTDTQQSVEPSIKQLAPEDGNAEDLRPSSASQNDDPPDLPVLEPSILRDQPVSVPPIEPLEAPAAPTSGTPSVSVPPIAPPETAETAEPTDPVEITETAEIINPADAVDATETAVAPAQNESEIPLEPPFIGDLAERTAPPATPVAVPDLTPDPATLPTLSAPTAPLPTEALASGSTPLLSPAIAEPAITEPVATEPAVTESVPASIPTVRPANVNRWPDPIPFGQPLPE